MTKIKLACTGLLLLAYSVTVLGDTQDCVINPRATIEMGSHQDGVLEAVLVQRGDHVSQGQPVARLDNKLEKMSAQLAKIRAESNIAIRSSEVQADFRAKEQQRLISLKDNSSVSESVYEQAVIESNLAALSVDSAKLEKRIARAEQERAETQLARRTIYSPVNGVVVDVIMSPGEYLHEQSTLMIIAEIDPLHVEVFIPVASFGQIEEGMSAKIRPEEPIGGIYPAEVAVVDRIFDAASRTFGVRLELPNPEFELPAGVRCTVTFEQGE